MKKLIAHLVWDDQGQDLIEYVLIGSVRFNRRVGRRAGARHGPQRLVQPGRSLG